MANSIENQIVFLIDGSGSMNCHIEKFFNYITPLIEYATFINILI